MHEGRVRGVNVLFSPALPHAIHRMCSRRNRMLINAFSDKKPLPWSTSTDTRKLSYSSTSTTTRFDFKF